jgi:hypothetical protein
MAHRGISRVLSWGFVVALLAAAVHLGWEYTHGGVQSHHLLARTDMPAISNWWGLLVLPLLGWLASRSATRRAAVDERAAGRSLAAFVGAALVGAALSLSFITGYESAASALFLAVLAAGLVLPTYRAEYLFGFVLGMSFILGAVLPTMAALVAAAISVVAHFLLRPGVSWLLRKARG